MSYIILGKLSRTEEVQQRTNDLSWDISSKCNPTTYDFKETIKMTTESSVKCPYLDEKTKECVHPSCVRLSGLECRFKEKRLWMKKTKSKRAK